MSSTTRISFKAGALALGLAAIGLISAANAATINYGNFGPVAPGVTFLDVKENSVSDPVPLYGPPAPFSVGLDFNPTGFVATTTGGGADLTDGQLNFTVDSNLPITNIGISERGDYTLFGAGTAATQVQAGSVLFATVTEINGLPVAPINLAPVNASVGFNLAANAGLVKPWALGLGLNVGVPGATRIDVVINNTLAAVSEANTVAFIAKKDFIVDLDVVPEPATAALAGMALCGLALARKRS